MQAQKGAWHLDRMEYIHRQTGLLACRIASCACLPACQCRVLLLRMRSPQALSWFCFETRPVCPHVCCSA